MSKGKKFIVLGDKTSHGGTVIGAWGQYGPTPMTIDGKAVACVGDPCTCPQKGHNNCVIIQGAEGPRATLEGKELAREGDLTSCGAVLISAGQSRAVHIPDGGGAGAAALAPAARKEAETKAIPAQSKGILTADSTPGISAEEVRLLAKQQKDEEKGYVTIFINNNGWAITKRQHAAVFVGREKDATRTLYDPCGSYSKGAGYATKDPNHKIVSRKGGILIGNDFSYHDYYLFHRFDGPNVNAFSFEITKSEENQIFDRIKADQVANTCWANCGLSVSALLDGIGPFKSLGTHSRPSTLSSAVRSLTKMSTSHKEKDVLNRMRGIVQ